MEKSPEGGMKLPLPKPDLDNRTFDQLVSEARTLIPGYSQEWTDHNMSDPGITFLELFAWLSEISLYRMNRVSDRHRIKYLKLLGASPQPARPSRIDLSFIPAHRQRLEKGMQVSTDIEGRTVYFELDEDADVTPATLDKIVVDEFTSGIFDRSSSNEKGDTFFAPFGEYVQKGCAMYLGFRTEDGIAPDSMNIMCYLYEKDLTGTGVHGDEQDHDFDNADLRWEISASADGREWKRIVPLDGTKDFKKSGRIIFEGIVDWIASSAVAGLRFSADHFWLRCRVEGTHYEYPPRIESLRLNTVSATHGLRVRNDNEERISNGFPCQVFKLRSTPVLDRTLKLSVAGEEWTQVEDLDGSAPSDRHFTLDNETGEIMFGDGKQGLVPPAGSAIEIIEYASGGGIEGNLNAGHTWKAEGFDGVIKNDRPSAGGRDAQTIEEAREAFLEDLGTPYTTVTSRDFEYLATNTPGLRVARAKAIPNYSPSGTKPDDPEENKGDVTVVVIPYTPLEVLRTPPQPSEGFKKAVCRHLDKHRLLGTEIYVIAPDYIKVSVNATIFPVDNFREDSLLLENVIGKLNGFLHPVKGGENGNGWPIGRDVYVSELYSLLEQVEGVGCVIGLSVSGDRGALHDADGNLLLNSRLACVYSGIHNVKIIRETGPCVRRG